MSKLMNKFLIDEKERAVFKVRGDDKEFRVYQPNEETQMLIKMMLLDMKSRSNEEWTRLFFKNLTNIDEVDSDVLTEESFKIIFNQERQSLVFREINEDISELVERETEIVGKAYSKINKLKEKMDKMSPVEKEQAIKLIKENLNEEDKGE